jgi:hypothetical protein
VDTTATTQISLIVPRSVAEQELRAAIKIGTAIRGQRLSEMRDLDEARREKQEWTARTSEMLDRLFGKDVVSEPWRAWTPPIYPEYAEFSMFRDLFDQEMKLRLSRLQTLTGKLEEIPVRAETTAHSVPMDQPISPTPVSEVPRRPGSEVAKNPGLRSTSDTGVAVPTLPVASAVPVGGNPSRVADEDSFPLIASEIEGRRNVLHAPLLRIGTSPGAAPAEVVLIVRLDDSGLGDPLTPFLQKLNVTVAQVDPRAGTVSVNESFSRHGVGYAVVVVPRTDALAGAYLFDLGCCVGHLGEDRVCTASAGGIAPDNRGLAHVSLDAGEGWQLQLARHLRRGGVDIDLNKLC